MRPRNVLSLLLIVPVAYALLSSARAAEAGDYAPANIETTASRMKYICFISAFCPVSEQVRGVIKGALANDRSDQYLLGLTLLTGDGLPQDRSAGVAWVALTAEHGDPDAARDIARRLRNGEAIAVDETKIAEALKPQVDAGDVDAMRALGPMYIGGRGVKQDPALGVNLLRHAVELGSSDAEVDLAQLYTDGAPGVPANRPEAMRWLAVSAGHGNVNAMLDLGYRSLMSSGAVKNVALGYCWLMRAALLDQVRAQEKLSLEFAEGEKDDSGMAIPIDLVQADLWFRLAARSPFHDNTQIRAMIEPNMTTDQIGQAKRLFEAWHKLSPQDVKTLTIPLPANPPSGAAGNCPPMT